MWMAIAIVVLAVAMVTGPILWVMPSKYQVKVAKLRQSALRQGLRVTINDVPPRAQCANGEQKSIAVYYLPWLLGEERDSASAARYKTAADQPWRLVYEKLDHDLHFYHHWQWSQDLAAPSIWHQPLRELLKDLPEGICALENTQQGIAVYWNERGDEQTLITIAELLRCLRHNVIQEAV